MAVVMSSDNGEDLKCHTGVSDSFLTGERRTPCGLILQKEQELSTYIDS